MAVDFARALRIRRSGSTYTYYGLTTAPSHYIAFRSQGATRYLPLVSLSGSSIPTQSFLRCRAGGVGYCAYGTLTFTITLSNTRTGTIAPTYVCNLATIKCNQGGVSLSASVTITCKTDSTTLSTTTVTLNANTTSQTYNRQLFSQAFLYPTSIGVKVVVNGKTALATATSYVQSGAQTISVSMRFTPW